MIYLFIEEKKEVGPSKAKVFFEALKKKKPDASFVILNSESFSDNALNEVLGTRGLFQANTALWLQDIFEKKENEEIILERIKEIESSEHIFVFSGKEFKAKILNALKKKAKQVFESKKKEEKVKEKFNIFSLTDALLNRDRKKLWINFHNALDIDSPEAIYGILFWQLKTMVIALKSKSANDSRLKPFVFSKAKLGLKNFKEGEVENMMIKLNDIYHKAHLGQCSFEEGLEEFVLGV